MARQAIVCAMARAHTDYPEWAKRDEAARQALMTDPTAILAPNLRPLASAAGDWLTANTIEPRRQLFQ